MKDLSINLFMVLAHRKYLLYFAAMYQYKLMCTGNAIRRFAISVFFSCSTRLMGMLNKVK